MGEKHAIAINDLKMWLRLTRSVTSTSNDFVLPEGSAPATVGVFKFYDRKATFHAEDGVTITRDGKPIQPKQIVELEMGEKHAIAINDLKMWLH